jgi:hypothetical protein
MDKVGQDQPAMTEPVISSSEITTDESITPKTSGVIIDNRSGFNVLTSDTFTNQVIMPKFCD